MTRERFYFDFDEIEANGPYCRIEEPYWPQVPTASGLLEQITGQFLRSRDRVRRILVDGTIRNLALAGDRMTAQLLFDGGEQPRLRGAVIEGDVRPPVYARDVRITPLNGDTTTEGEGS